MRGDVTRRGFTLVELLVVVGIIGLLIGILLPSLSGARNSAKNMSTATKLEAIEQALEMFNNDIGEYPDSSKRLDPVLDSSLPGDTGNCTLPQDDKFIYGAQSLVYGLMGRDLKGYVDPRRARKFNADAHPCNWYIDLVTNTGDDDYPRETLYLAEKNVVALNEVTQGRRPQGAGNDYMSSAALDAYVILDSFDRPILYYRCNTKGRTQDKDLCTDALTGNLPTYNPNGRIPYYSLIDNELFTGNQGRADSWIGWKFGTIDHQLRYLGDPDAPDVLDDNDDPYGSRTTFSKYIHDHAAEEAGGATNTRPRPVKDTFLLISAGEDGVYGTPDDINNFSPR